MERERRIQLPDGTDRVGRIEPTFDRGVARHDEVWDGDYVVMPVRDVEHQRVVSRICYTLSFGLEGDGTRVCLPGANVSDRTIGWLEEFRIPDVVVCEAAAAKEIATHLVRGIELVVEVATPGDRCREKIDFYRHVGVKEVVIVDRAPWRIERHDLADGGAVAAAVGDSVQTASPAATWHLTAVDASPHVVVDVAGRTTALD